MTIDPRDQDPKFDPWYRAVGVVVGVALLVLAGLAVVHDAKGGVDDGERPHGECRAVLHRGFHDADTDEEVPASIVKADRYPQARVELDLRLTSDKFTVFVHDDTVDRVFPNGHGPVEDMTFAQTRNLRSAHNGVPPMTLGQALTVLNQRNDVYANIEVKRWADEWSEQKLLDVVDAVRDAGLLQQTYFTGTKAVTDVLKERRPAARVYVIYTNGPAPSVNEVKVARGADYVFLFGPVDETAAQVRAYADAGLSVGTSLGETRAAFLEQYGLGYRKFWTDTEINTPDMLEGWCK